jgi:hypothetical protein
MLLLAIHRSQTKIPSTRMSRHANHHLQDQVPTVAGFAILYHRLPITTAFLESFDSNTPLPLSKPHARPASSRKSDFHHV